MTAFQLGSEATLVGSARRANDWSCPRRAVLNNSTRLVSPLEWPLALPAHVVDRRFLPTAPRLGYRQALAGLLFGVQDRANFV